MTTRTTTKLLALTLGATLSITCLSTVVVSMHSASAPATATAIRTIELPTVIVVGPKSATVNATALATSTRANKV